MIDGLHSFLNFVLFDPYSDLAWAGVRTVTALAALFVAWNMREQKDRLFWLSCSLGGWIALKVFDDLQHPAIGQKLTVYFLVSNVLWTLIQLNVSRRVLKKGDR